MHELNYLTSITVNLTFDANALTTITFLQKLFVYNPFQAIVRFIDNYGNPSLQGLR